MVWRSCRGASPKTTPAVGRDRRAPSPGEPPVPAPPHGQPPSPASAASMTPAADKLRSLLSADWRPATAVTSEAEALGLSRDQIRGAREALGVTRVNGAVAFRAGHWCWRLRPDGCPTCGRSWHGPWTQVGGDGDYWSQPRPSAPISHDGADDNDPHDEPAAPITSPAQPPLRDSGPPRCSVCGKASALEPGHPCPYSRPDGQRCVGVVQ
jgi:hypothetical protein